MTDSNPPDRSLSFRLGTRASKLALVQAHQAAKDFTSSLSPSSSYSNLSFPVIPMSVAGDRNKTSPLYLLSTSTSIITPAKSLWTEELETALLKGELDAIINCCKDTPTNLPEGCEIGMLFPRPDPRDVLVVKHGLEYKTLGDLPDGSVVGTSSVRRIAQLRRHYPRLKVMDVRGNLDTRLAKLDDPTGPFSAIILASAGLIRLSLSSRITSTLSSPEMPYAVAQGALAVEIRKGDKRAYDVLRGMGCWKTEWEIGVERGLLNELEGGCSVPVGVETVLEEVEIKDGENQSSSMIPRAFESEPETPTEDSPLLYHSGFGKTASVRLIACITSLDGQQQVIHNAGPVLLKSFGEADAWGHEMAKVLLEKGGDKILAEINEVRQQREIQDKAMEAQNLAEGKLKPDEK